MLAELSHVGRRFEGSRPGVGLSVLGLGTLFGFKGKPQPNPPVRVAIF